MGKVKELLLTWQDEVATEEQKELPLEEQLHLVNLWATTTPMSKKIFKIGNFFCFKEKPGVSHAFSTYEQAVEALKKYGGQK